MQQVVRRSASIRPKVRGVPQCGRTGWVCRDGPALPTHAQIQPTDKVSELEEFATALVTIKSTQERERLLSQKKDLMTPDLRKALIQKGNIHLANGQYSTAFDIYGLAKNIARQIGDTEGIATASLDIGTVYYFQANYPAALQHYREARELFTEITNNYESAKALSGVGLIYREQRRDADALQTFQQALTEFTALNDRVEMANTLNSIGVIYYGQGDYAAAAEAFRRSEDALKSTEHMKATQILIRNKEKIVQTSQATALLT